MQPCPKTRAASDVLGGRARDEASRTGWTPTGTGSARAERGPGRPAARTTPGRPTSTTMRSIPSVGHGAPSSPATAAASRARPELFPWSRRRIRAASSRRSRCRPVRVRRGGRAVPDAVAVDRAEPERRAVRGTDAHAGTDARTHADADAHARTDADADARGVGTPAGPVTARTDTRMSCGAVTMRR